MHTPEIHTRFRKSKNYVYFRLHWLPPEFFEIPNLCKTHVAADIYSAGTTLWELFSMGEKPPNDLPIATYKAVCSYKYLISVSG